MIQQRIGNSVSKDDSAAKPTETGAAVDAWAALPCRNGAALPSEIGQRDKAYIAWAESRFLNAAPQVAARGICYGPSQALEATVTGRLPLMPRPQPRNASRRRSSSAGCSSGIQ